jgi:hypothetical protein
VNDVQHWYVYYKMPRSERAALLAQVRDLQQRVARAVPVRMRLLERAEQAEMMTLMEVYEDIGEPERFGAALDAALRASGLGEAQIAARRIERFQDA